jgi:type 1 glutamine amidotransferase
LSQIRLAAAAAGREDDGRSRLAECLPADDPAHPDLTLLPAEEPNAMTVLRVLCAGCIAMLLTAQPAAADDKPLSAQSAAPLQVCLISGPHYSADASLGEFQKYLEEHYQVKCSRVITQEYPLAKELPGIEAALSSADVLVVFTRRVEVPAEQLELLKKYCAAGRPVLGIRTASHAFQNWSGFSKEVLGAKFGPHYNNAPMQVELVEKTKDHPILAGVKPFSTTLGLYKYQDHAADLQMLLMGTTKEHAPEPVAWAREVNGGRVFYTSLGGTKDFQDENYRQLLVNALFWLTQRDAAKMKK